MGKVLIIFRLMPTGPDVDMEGLSKAAATALPSGAALRGTSIQPIAFGLKALNLSVVVADEEGWTDKLEQSLGALPGVQGVEVTGQSLL